MNLRPILGSLCLLATLIPVSATTVASSTSNVSVAPHRDRYETIRWDEASDHYGETVVVVGPVLAAATDVLGPETASILLGDPTASTVDAFKIVIAGVGTGLHGYPDNFSEYYLGHEVSVIGTVTRALVGGAEIIPTQWTQVHRTGDPGRARLPDGRVDRLPRGAISFEDAVDHIGETKTVCGVGVGGVADTVPGLLFPGGLTLPPEIVAELPPDFEQFLDMRVFHELWLGDRMRFSAWVLDDAARTLPLPARDYFLGENVCARGEIEITIFIGAQIVVESLDDIWVVDERGRRQRPSNH